MCVSPFPILIKMISMISALSEHYTLIYYAFVPKKIYICQCVIVNSCEGMIF